MQARWPLLLKGVLLLVLLVQGLRLFWVIVTPVGPMGEWRGRQADIPAAAARASLFVAFDPFYPAAPATPGAQNVTALALSLFGVRINEGSGLGSAIIAGSDGVQNSYAAGEEILPGVRLKTVQFDHVVIDRNGVEESIFLDQSAPVSAPAAGESAAPEALALPPGTAPEKPSSGGIGAMDLKTGVGFGPRMSGGRITGIVLTRKGPGFEAAGFRPGDVITQVNGRPIGSADDLAAVQRTFSPGARISLMVERGAQVVPIAIVIEE